MKGLILAGGTGSRLFPTTLPVCKQLLPIYDKPMIYYPLSVLMRAGIREILIIVRPMDLQLFKNTLQDGSQWGLEISYVTQERPSGLPEAYILGEQFLGNSPSTLILGDNFLYAQNLQTTMKTALTKYQGGCVFSYAVKDPENYGVISLDQNGQPTAIIEKPKEFVSNLAVPGLYIFDERAPEIAKSLVPSKRGETEITDIIKFYLEAGELDVVPFGRGTAWLDSGTSASLLQASQFVQTIQQRQGLGIACLEEIAYTQGFIDQSQLAQAAQKYKNSPYLQLFKKLVV